MFHEFLLVMWPLWLIIRLVWPPLQRIVDAWAVAYAERLRDVQQS